MPQFQKGHPYFPHRARDPRIAEVVRMEPAEAARVTEAIERGRQPWRTFAFGIDPRKRIFTGRPDWKEIVGARRRSPADPFAP